MIRMISGFAFLMGGIAALIAIWNQNPYSLVFDIFLMSVNLYILYGEDK